MAEKILDLLGLAFRQKAAFYRIGEIFSSLINGGFSLKRVLALFIAITESFSCALFDTGLTPLGESLDLDGYNLVFEDEFDGSSLDLESWEYRATGQRRGGFNSESQVKVENGNLVITAQYLEDGDCGPGWYAGMINLKEKYCRGYFEIRCKCNAGGDFWSAFWFQAESPYDAEISKGGTGGAEIDIFEADNYNKSSVKSTRNAVTTTIHCNGVDDNPDEIDSRILGRFYPGNNIYEEYNTYGVKWTEDEYIFYINGVETARSSFGNGTSQVPEELVVSLEIPEDISLDKSSVSQYTVDYVRIWQEA